MKIVTVVLIVFCYVIVSIICGGIFLILEADRRGVSVRKNIRDNMNRPEEYFALGILSPFLILTYVVYRVLLSIFRIFGKGSFLVAKKIAR